MKNYYETVGKRIRAARRKKKVSQAELALRIGSTQPVISRVEGGGQNVSIGYVEKIASALRVPVKAILCGK